jgi:hypothetical protein
MALLTVDDLQTALGGTPLSDAQKAQARYYIDVVSAYIENRTGVTFSHIVNERFRCYADDQGEIDLKICPISEVGSITDRETGNEVFGWYFDGERAICGLRPNCVYDVILSYGFHPVPADIRGVATEAVKRALSTGVTGFTTTGEVFRPPEMMDFSRTDTEILESYGPGSETTWRLAGPAELSGWGI